MSLVAAPTLASWVAELLETSELREDTRAYIVGVMATITGDGLLGPRDSVVLAYAEARQHYDFARFQRLGDWVLWVDVWYPRHIEQNQHVVESIGRFSYEACHRITKRSWPVYEELADDLPRIVRSLRRCLPGTTG